MTTRHATTARHSAFMILLARYVSGQITDSQWERLNGVLDAEGVTINERMAFARFVNEALSDNLAWSQEPRAGDAMTGVLSEIRASKAA